MLQVNLGITAFQYTVKLIFILSFAIITYYYVLKDYFSEHWMTGINMSMHK